MNYSHYLLVDGYNIIHAWDCLREIASSSVSDARARLSSRLANYQGYKGIGILLVFDAYLVKGGVETYEWDGGVCVVYTKEAETADIYIERATDTLTKKHYKVTVATSDILEQIIIMSRGAIRLSAEHLKRDVEEAEAAIRKKADSLKPIKNNQLFDNLDPKTAEMFDSMRYTTKGIK
jgi:predicted RNA-binding protein with PIN domain